MSKMELTVAVVAALISLVGCKEVMRKSNAQTGADDRVQLSWLQALEGRQRSKRALFDSDTRRDILDLHNNLRRQEGSSNMELMFWNQDLADMAEDWAKTCYWGHGQPDRDRPPFDVIGQNLYVYNGTFDPLVGIQAFYDEKPYYDYDTGHCSYPPCGHYTQVVWDSSVYLGCAYSYCPSMQNIDLINGNYLVCNYGPGGNWVGQKPFKKGEACSQCESGDGWCRDGLCTSLSDSPPETIECRANCKNCGKRVFVSNEECHCECQAGWNGPDCSEECVDTHEYCGANPGWPLDWCDRDYVKQRCPAFCGLCQAGTSECQEETSSSSAPTPSTLSSTSVSSVSSIATEMFGRQTTDERVDIDTRRPPMSSTPSVSAASITKVTLQTITLLMLSLLVT